MAKSLKPSLQAKIWSDRVLSHGIATFPSLLLKEQVRLGLSPLQLNIVMNLIADWHEPDRAPFPSKRDLAGRIGCSEKAIHLNIQDLEKQGLVRRELRPSSSDGWSRQVYDLSGLIERVKALDAGAADLD